MPRLRHTPQHRTVGVPTVEIIDGPKVVSQPDIHYVGLRVITPFRGMLAVRDKLMAELHERNLPEAGPPSTA